MDDWNPISTVQLDEDGCAELIVFDPDYGVAVAVFDYSVADGDDCGCAGAWSVPVPAGENVLLHPTHWMELPACPDEVER